MNFMPGEFARRRGADAAGRDPAFGRGSRSHREPRVTVIVGIRPESFEDASVVSRDVSDRGMTFKAKIDLVESWEQGVRLLRGPGHPGRLG